MEEHGILSFLKDLFFSFTGLFYIFITGIILLQSKLISDQKNKIDIYENNISLISPLLKKVIEDTDTPPHIKELAEETINKLKPINK